MSDKNKNLKTAKDESPKLKKVDEKSDSDKQYLNIFKDFRPTSTEDYGYFFYPQRFGCVREPEWYEKYFSYGVSRELIKKSQCEQNVQKAIEKHPGVKLLLSAMKSVGCEVNLLRHFSCEFCDKAIKGGFDPSTNQSILCYNTIDNRNSHEFALELVRSLLPAYDYCRANYNFFDLKHLACTQIILCHNRVYKYEDCAEILSHELVHTFDYCRTHLDINNNYHVACSEIRAANLTSCSLMEAFANDAAFFWIKNTHKECVRRKAALSLQMVRNLSEQEAFRVIDSVFEKCYNDLEPFGRRITGEKDCERAYKDRFKFGYE